MSLKGDVPSLAAAVLLIMAAAVFGGGSLDVPLRSAAVELCALPALFLGLRGVLHGGWRRHRAALTILGVAAAIPLIQLIPLPPWLWERLPGRSLARQALALAGGPAPWLPLTLSSAETRRSALALIPPSASFLVTLRLPGAAGRGVIALWLALGLAGLALGALQIVSWGTMRLELYREAIPGAFVGWFANRNHFASLLLALVPLAAVLMASPARWPRWLALVFLSAAVVGLAAIRSRAGIVLLAPAMLGAALVVLLGRGPSPPGSTRPTRGDVAFAGACALAAAAAVALLSLSPLLSRFSAHGPPESRLDLWPYVIKAAESYLPFGAGVGAFSRAFQMVEPLSLAAGTPLPHAHNEYLEVWLEAGWFGAAALAAFVAWLAITAWRAWRQADRTAQAVGVAAAVSIGLILAHAGVDYAMRTLAVSSLFGFCCGLLAATGVAREPDPDP